MHHVFPSSEGSKMELIQPRRLLALTGALGAICTVEVVRQLPLKRRVRRRLVVRFQRHAIKTQTNLKRHWTYILLLCRVITPNSAFFFSFSPPPLLMNWTGSKFILSNNVPNEQGRQVLWQWLLEESVIFLRMQSLLARLALFQPKVPV